MAAAHMKMELTSKMSLVTLKIQTGPKSQTIQEKDHQGTSTHRVTVK